MGGRICGPGAALLAAVLAASLLAACAAQRVATTPPTTQDAGAGAVVAVGHRRRGRGSDRQGQSLARRYAVAPPSEMCSRGSVTEISSRAARESVSANQPVAYQSTDGWQRIEAVPQTRNTRGCRQVHERVYQDNRLVREQIREVC